MVYTILEKIIIVEIEKRHLIFQKNEDNTEGGNVHLQLADYDIYQLQVSGTF